MEEALRLIITKSPLAASQAMETIRAIHAKSPILQIRYNNTVQMALNDPQAEFTPAERALLAEFVGSPDSSTNRDFMLRVRLTDAERAALQQSADQAQQSMSEYVRQKIFE